MYNEGKVRQGTYIGRLIHLLQGLPHRKNLALQSARRGRVECVVGQPQLRGYLCIGQIPISAVMAQGPQALAALGSAGDKAGPRPCNGKLVLELAHLRVDLFGGSAFGRNNLKIRVRRWPFGFGFRGGPRLLWLCDPWRGPLRRR